MPRIPFQQGLRIADRGRQTHALKFPSGHAPQSFQDAGQVPSAIVAGKGVYLVHNDRPQVRKQPRMVRAARNQHALQ